MVVRCLMMMVMVMFLMMNDFDGALEMDDGGPLMEIAYGDGQLQP